MTKAELQLVRSLADKRGRTETGLFVAEGAKLVGELRASHLRVRKIFALEGLFEGPEVECVTPRDMERLSLLKTASNSLALVEIPRYRFDAAGAGRRLTLALDQVQNPGNLGTLCRSLYALGGAGVLLPRHNSAYLGPAAQRAAAGALERLPIARVDNLGHALDSAEEAGLTIYGAGCGGASSVSAFDESLRLPAVLVLGNEDKGLRPGVAKRCSRMLHIPLARPFDSLNVAQAGAILLGLAAQQLRRA